VQVVDDGTAPQIEQILALAAVTGAPSLPVAYMSQSMLHSDALAQAGATGGGVLLVTQPGQEPLVRMDADAAPARTGGTPGA
jgi:hypothetical protein